MAESSASTVPAKDSRAAAKLVKDEIKAGKLHGITAAEFDLLCNAAS